MIKAVLFDMDGILYDSEYWYMQGTIKQMRAYGYKGPEKDIITGIVGKTMEGTYRALYDLLGGEVPYETIRRNNDRYFDVEHPLDYKEIMFPHVKEVLAALHADGKKLAVCSSSPMQLIVDSLKAMEIASYFDFVESGENLKHAKPAPDIYLKAAEALHMNPKDCVVYEDSCAGIQAGINAGIYTVARHDTRFYQDQSMADKSVNSIEELYDWIRKEDTDAGSHKN